MLDVSTTNVHRCYMILFEFVVDRAINSIRRNVKKTVLSGVSVRKIHYIFTQRQIHTKFSRIFNKIVRYD